MIVQLHNDAQCSKAAGAKVLPQRRRYRNGLPASENRDGMSDRRQIGACTFFQCAASPLHGKVGY